jgi:hypothetical protein
MTQRALHLMVSRTVSLCCRARRKDGAGDEDGEGLLGNHCIHAAAGDPLLPTVKSRMTAAVVGFHGCIAALCSTCESNRTDQFFMRRTFEESLQLTSLQDDVAYHTKIDKQCIE